MRRKKKPLTVTYPSRKMLSEQSNSGSMKANQGLYFKGQWPDSDAGGFTTISIPFWRKARERTAIDGQYWVQYWVNLDSR